MTVKISRNYFTGTIKLSSDNWEHLFIEMERWENKGYYAKGGMYSNWKYQCNLKMRKEKGQLEKRLEAERFK